MKTMVTLLMAAGVTAATGGEFSRITFQFSSRPAPAFALAAAQAEPACGPDALAEPLAAYGQWLQVESVGAAWQPYVAAEEANWHPYGRSGYWVLTPAGRCWRSHYTWGATVYGCGDWQFRSDVGWFWVPPRRVVMPPPVVVMPPPHIHGHAMVPPPCHAPAPSCRGVTPHHAPPVYGRHVQPRTRHAAPGGFAPAAHEAPARDAYIERAQSQPATTSRTTVNAGRRSDRLGLLARRH